MSYKQISAARRQGEKEASKLLGRYSKVVLPVPIREIAVSEGCSVRSSALDDKLSGLAFIKEGQRHIVYNAHHHPNRQRFTIAHELGHHIMHSRILRESVHVDKGTLRRDDLSSHGIDSIEIAANAFAATLLMPEACLKNLSATPIDLEDERTVMELAKKFAVSPVALTNRILNLSLG